MPFTFGGVFSRFFRLIGENFGLFAGFGLLLTVLPVVAGNYAMLNLIGATQDTWASKAGEFTTQSWLIGAGLTLGIGILSLFNMAAITEIAILRSVGKKVDIGAVLSHSAGNIIPMFVISLIVGLLTGLCFLLLIVPGIMYAVASCVAVPAYVGQPGIGLWGAVQKSYELTRNNRWIIFFLFLVGLIALTTVESAITVPLAIGPMRDTFKQNPAAAAPPSDLVFLTISSALNGISSVISQIFVVAIYICLRQSKEKATPAGAAAVFE